MALSVASSRALEEGMEVLDEQNLLKDEQDLLKEVPTDGAAVGNKTLLARMQCLPYHWDKEKFGKIRELLIVKGLLVRGKGQGGSVRRAIGNTPVAMAPAAPGSTRPLAPQRREEFEEIFEEIKEYLYNNGSLTFAQIVDWWPSVEQQFAELKKWLLQQHGIKAGRPHTGGFILDSPLEKGAPPHHVQHAPAHMACIGRWEQRAVDRLTELLSYEELEGFLGDQLRRTLRLLRRRAGEDRRGTKVELAHALVIQGGVDLFFDPSIRTVIARKCGKEAPGKWHPGKSAACVFAEQTGFPMEMAGEANQDWPEDFEYLEGPVGIKLLEKFQEEVKGKLLNCFKRRDGRAMLVLPTGAGKTRVAVESVRDWLSERHYSNTGTGADLVLWLAHSGELCDQAYSEFKQLWQATPNVCPLLLVRFYGTFSQAEKHRNMFRDVLTHPSVIVSTPQRFQNLLKDPSEEVGVVRGNLRDRLRLVVIDEAHRAAAPIYKQIMIYVKSKGIPIVGLTATPFSKPYLPDSDAGTSELQTLFVDLVEPIETLGLSPRSELQRMGILARPKWETIKTQSVITSPLADIERDFTEEELEQIDRAYSAKADNPARRHKVFEQVLKTCSDSRNSVLYFGPSINDAQLMAFMLRSEGIPATAVTGATRDITRRQLIADFKSKRIRVLCNCQVLTTGFDAPLVTHVVMARPTVSQVLYEQMVGRGMRGKKFGGTEECVIIDCEDNYKSSRPALGYQAFRHLWMATERQEGAEESIAS